MIWIMLIALAAVYLIMLKFRRSTAAFIVLPFAVTGFIAVADHEIIGIICDREDYGRLLAPIGALALSLVIVIPIIVTMIKCCAVPLKRQDFGGSDIMYEKECAQRRMPLLWVCISIATVSLILTINYGIVTVGALALASFGAMVTPFLWLFFIGTLGFGILIYAGMAIEQISTEIQLFMGFTALSGIYVLLSMVLVGTILRSIGKITGKAERHGFLKVISVIVPVLGIITVKKLSKRLNDISAEK